MKGSGFAGRTIGPGLAIALGLAVASYLSTRPEVNCDAWGMQFFETASVGEVRACIEAGADVMGPDSYNRETPLHWAASVHPRPAVIELLPRRRGSIRSAGPPRFHAAASGVAV